MSFLGLPNMAHENGDTMATTNANQEMARGNRTFKGTSSLNCEQICKDSIVYLSKWPLFSEVCLLASPKQPKVAVKNQAIKDVTFLFFPL